MRKRLLNLAAVLFIAAPFIGAGDSTRARFVDLGHRMMCTCGCNQILLECNHVGCTESEKMRGLLQAQLDNGESDKAVLDAFTNKYGPIVLAAPTAQGFDLVAWWMPAAVLLAGGVLAVMVARRWKRQQTPELADTAHLGAWEARDDLRERARRETEL